jgi:hypothetical protein
MCVCIVGDVIITGLRNHMIIVKGEKGQEGIVQTNDVIIAMRRVTENMIACLGKGGEVFLYKVVPENNIIGMKL